MKINSMALIVALLLGMAAAGDEPATNLRTLIDDSIGWYELLPGAGRADAMKPVVALRWPNSIRGSSDGATVVWVVAGRPEAVAAIYPWEDLFIHEFDSLSRGKIVADDDEVVWSPTTDGLQFRPIDGAPAPARSPKSRLRQMKALAKDFKASLLGWNNDNSDREALRPMSRPIYRYEIDKPDKVLDGALVAFAIGTDPEVLLVIEAFGREGVYKWQYAFVRRSSGGLEGRFRNRVVWTANRHPKQKDPTSNHVSFSRPLDEVLVSEE